MKFIEVKPIHTSENYKILYMKRIRNKDLIKNTEVLDPLENCKQNVQIVEEFLRFEYELNNLA